MVACTSEYQRIPSSTSVLNALFCYSNGSRATPLLGFIAMPANMKICQWLYDDDDDGGGRGGGHGDVVNDMKMIRYTP